MPSLHRPTQEPQSDGRRNGYEQHPCLEAVIRQWSQNDESPQPTRDHGEAVAVVPGRAVPVPAQDQPQREPVQEQQQDHRHRKGEDGCFR